MNTTFWSDLFSSKFTHLVSESKRKKNEKTQTKKINPYSKAASNSLLVQMAKAFLLGTTRPDSNPLCSTCVGWLKAEMRHS